MTAVKPKSNAHKTVLLGLTYGFQNKNQDNFIKYGEEYIKHFGKETPGIAQKLQSQINVFTKLRLGVVAPDFAQVTPNGDTLKLSDLRGKVVMIDFWASWCRPCRQENPRVREVYAKYKDKGFEILGVSLDNNKQRWIDAIEKDQLPWPHVSDLKQWKNEAARMYNVSSIPYTVLLDEDGKIIAKKLRAHQLEGKLAEIFGE